MCICSVLTRAVMATLLSHWESYRDKSARNSPSHLDATCRVIQCLSKVSIPVKSSIISPILMSVKIYFKKVEIRSLNNLWEILFCVQLC